MMKKQFPKKRTGAEFLNELSFRVLYEHYKTIALNAFKWEGLPEGIEERYIERALFDEGKVLFFRDPRMSYMCLPCCQGSGLDVYNEPLRWRAMGLNYNKEYPRDKCVLIENNKIRSATHDVIVYFVQKMYEASRTMDVNLQTAKMPFVMKCDEKQLLTYKAIWQKIQANEPAIFATDAISLDTMDVIPTRVTFMGNDLMDFSRSVESQLLTFLGIDNCPVDKKERLITDEATSNNELISINADLMLEARQRAAEAINKMYGLSVSVDLRHKPKEVSADDPDGADKADGGAAGRDRGGR